MEAYKIFIAFTLLLFILSILIVINKFVGNRIFKVLQGRFPNINYKLYMILFWLMTGSIWVAYLTRNKIPFLSNELLMTAGMMWLTMLPIMLILEIIVLIVDKLIKNSKFASSKHLNMLIKLYNKGFLQLVVAIAVTIYGAYNAFNINVVNYDIYIDKQANVDSLNIAFLSDTHGFSSSNFTLNNDKGLAAAVNKLNPDVILLGGDLIDELSQPGKIEAMSEELSKLSSKYGVYGVLGNHDIRANTDIIDFFKKSNITLLKDSYIDLNGIYIVGSDYHEENSYDYINSLDIDTDKPVIYIQHVPTKRSENISSKIDLHLSGHTHKGQVFPASFITNMLFSNDHGYSVIDDVQTITSSGFGVWGPKVRIGSKSELVNVNIKFNNEKQ